MNSNPNQDQVARTLSERGDQYGPAPAQFKAIQQCQQELLHIASNQGRDDAVFQHVAYMILTKLARLAWTPTHEDSWRDIEGYVRLYKSTP